MIPSYSSASPPLRKDFNIGWRFKVHPGQLTILPVNTASPMTARNASSKTGRMEGFIFLFSLASSQVGCRLFVCDSQKPRTLGVFICLYESPQRTNKIWVHQRLGKERGSPLFTATGPGVPRNTLGYKYHRVHISQISQPAIHQRSHHAK